MNYALNSADFGHISLWPSVRGQDPAHTAINNEHFRHYRDGMIRSLFVVDEEIARLEHELANLRGDADD